MIVTIRKTLQGNKYILVGLVVALCIVWLLPPSSQRNARFGQGAMATVNGYEIPYDDFARALRSQQEYVSSLRMQYGQLADDFLREMGLDDQRRLTAHVYETLIRQTLLEQFANNLKIYLNADYITEVLNDSQAAPMIFSGLVPRAVFDEVGGLNAQALQRYLRQMGMTITEFEEKIEQTLKTRMAIEVIDSGLYVPDFYLMDYYKMSVLGKKFSIITFDREAFIAAAKKETISDEELKAFFDKENAARQRYFVSEKRTGKTWEFTAHTYGIAVESNDIQSYYEEYKVKKYLEKPAQVQVRRILCAVHNEADTQFAYEKAKRIREELAGNPSRFVALAQESSDDKATAKNGGLLPFFTKEEKEKSVAKAAFLLKAEGDISDIVQSKDGFEILQLVARQQPTYKSLASVSTDIKKELTQKRFEQQFAHDMQNIVRGAQSMENFIKEHHDAKVGSTGTLSADDSVVATKLFGINRKDAGTAIAFYIEGDKGYVMQLTDIQDRYLPELSAVKNVVMQDLYEARAMKTMAEFLRKSQQELLAGAAVKDIAAQYHGKTEQTAMIKQSDKDAMQKLKNKGLPTDRIMMLMQEGAVSIAQDNDQGYIVRLDALETFGKDEFNAQKKQLVRTVRRDTTRVYTDAFVASLQRNATIKPNENLNTSGK